MKRAALLILAVMTVIAVDASFRSIDESRKFTIVITEPENSLIAYECGLKVKLRPGHWSAVKVAELKNRMTEGVVITYSNHSWIEGGDDIRFIGMGAPMELQPLERGDMMGGFIVGEHAKGGKLYFEFTATWPNGSAIVNTGVCPLEIVVVGNTISIWAMPEEHFTWDEGRGGYFYYGGGDARIPLMASHSGQVGWLEITGSGGNATICYNLTSSGYILERVNLVVNGEEIADSNPENYTYVAENIGRESFCLDISGFDEGYVAAHAVIS